MTPVWTLSMADGARAVVDRLDQEAEQRRALAAGELVLMPEALRPAPVVTSSTSPDELVRQFWRWAAWGCPNGVPSGWTAAERPRDL